MCRLSPSEILDRLRGVKPSKVGPHDMLRSSCWLSYVLYQCGTMKALEEVIYEGHTTSKLIGKWLSGKTQVSRRSAEKTVTIAPGSLDFFDLPLWNLLEDRMMEPQDVGRMMQRYRWPNPHPMFGPYWWFPNDDDMLRQRRYGGTVIRADTDGLFQRGDLYGFTAIVAAVRHAESEDPMDHVAACANMYRCLPSLYKMPWFATNRVLLESCLHAIRARVWMSRVAFDIDWNVINRQVLDVEYQPKRELRMRDPVTWEFKALEDPILPSKIIPGAVVRKRELARDRSRDRSARAAPTTPSKAHIRRR